MGKLLVVGSVALEDSVRLGFFHIDARWLAIFVATLVPFLVVVIAKRAARRPAI